MNDNFKSIIWLAGHFGVVVREHAEELIYTGKYGKVNANLTFGKLEREHGLLKRIDRGKRKTDGYRLSNEGIKFFRKYFGYEPKNYNSSDKLQHSVHIANFYCEIIKDLRGRNIISDMRILKEKEKVRFNVQQSIQFHDKNENEDYLIPDAIGHYKYQEKRAIIFFLEIENSDRKSSQVAIKTLENYEGYYLSGKWKSADWQPPNRKVFPPVLIVTYSDFKVKELIRYINMKKKINLTYLFTTYQDIRDYGLSADIWTNLNGEKTSLLI